MLLRASLFFHNWKAKLGSLALATVLWLVIRHSVNYGPSQPTPPVPATPEALPRE